MITHCYCSSLLMRTLKWNLYKGYFLPFLFLSTTMKMCFHFEILFSHCCHQGMALVLVCNRSERPYLSFFFFFYTLEPQGLKWLLSHVPLTSNSSTSPLSEVDHVTGNGSVLLWSFWVAANLRYRGGESGSAAQLPADSLKCLWRVCYGVASCSVWSRWGVQWHKEDGVKDVTELCPAGMSTCNRISLQTGNWKRWGAAWVGDDGDACPGTQLPLFCCLKRQSERGGWRRRRGQRWFEMISKGVAVLQAACARYGAQACPLRISSCSGIVQIKPAYCFRSWRACFFQCGSLDSRAGGDLAWRRMGCSREAPECQWSAIMSRPTLKSESHKACRVPQLHEGWLAEGKQLNGRQLDCYGAGLCGDALTQLLCVADAVVISCLGSIPWICSLGCPGHVVFVFLPCLMNIF